ncbi:sensor histidine kinase [Clostridium sp.]|uniref:sensor histidine kinase n=1 Tax=Clostridium sp. TaxID=1506 RepID=UPI0026DAB069|nr:sensor histidine kinase [Clostridium sp.]MDO5039838.1 two-component regulator propeller domain-containing protein [Clostridium sp.]
MNEIKRGKLIINILCILIIINNFFCVKANAVEENKYLKFTNITVRDGLSQGSVFSILRDSDGYMWFGTNDGLNRFNGYEYEVIKSEDKDKDTIFPGIIESIVEDKDGYLWIGTSSGLSKLDRETLKAERIEADANDPYKILGSHIWDIYIDSSNHMWVATEDGLNEYDPKTKKFKKYFSEENKEDTLYDGFITSIMEGLNGEMWISTQKGLNIINKVTGKITKVLEDKLPSKNILKLYKDMNNNMWIATQDKGIYKFNLKTKEFDNLENINRKYAFEKYAINSMYEDFNNNIWLGSKGGLIKYNNKTKNVNIYINKPYDQESLINNSVKCVYRDSDGLMWIGTYNGISMLNPNPEFTHYKSQPGETNTLSGNSIGGIYEDEDGILWVGTNNDGLNKFDRENDKITHYKFDKNNPNSIPSNTLFQVTGDGNGNIWMATKEGLCKLNKKTGDIKTYRHESNKNSLVHNDVKEVYFDKNGLLWVGTRQGLDVFNPKTEKFTNLNYLFDKAGVCENYIRRVFQDSKGNYWIATGWNGGILKLDVEKKKAINYTSIENNPNSLSNNAIKGINEDKEGNMWFSTSVGLNKFDPRTEKFTIFTEKDGLANNYVYGVLLDDEDNVWVSTNGGISKYDKHKKKFENYNLLDGLQGNEFNGTAEFKAKDGEMFFGGVNGVTAFYPKDIYTKPLSNPNIKISKFKVYNNKNIQIKNDSIELKHNENTFSFEFFLPDYKSMGTENFEYQLEGFDKGWIYLGKRNYVSYTNIPPGKYIFKVRARDKNGEVTDVKEVKIQINKPWYNSNLAYLIYLFLILLIIYFIVNYVKILNRLVKQRTEQLNKELLENEKMYNKLLKYEKFRNTYLVNLSHELRTPLNVILSSEQLISSLNDSKNGIGRKDLSKYMKIIKKNSTTLLKVINDLIDSSKISSGAYKLNISEEDIVYLVEEVALSMKSYIESNNLELIIDPEIEEKIIECDKTNIERCVINLISNAVKFTKSGGTIFVEIKDNHDSVDIIVRDTGIGIPKDYQNIIFDRFAQVETQVSSKHCSSGIGLTLVKNLVELHKGKITLKSEVGKGSEFIITLPVKQEKSEE